METGRMPVLRLRSDAVGVDFSFGDFIAAGGEKRLSGTSRTNVQYLQFAVRYYDIDDDEPTSLEVFLLLPGWASLILRF